MSPKIKVEGLMEITQAAGHLEEVLNSLKEGNIRVRSGSEEMILKPEKVVEFEMKVSRKKDKEKLSLEISWNTSKDKQGKPELKISS